MMNILLITAHFPSYDFPEKTYATPFLFQYAYEWVKMGNRVHIIHFARNYPIGFNLAAKTLSTLGNNRLLRYSYNAEAMNDADYEYQGVHIIRFKYRKYIPHGRTNKGTIRKLAFNIKEYLKIEQIEPNLIIGDCFDPVINIISQSFREYLCPKYQIVHSTDITRLEEYKEDLKQFDALLLRSQKQEQEIRKILGNFKYKYMYSGITEAQVDKEPVFRSKIHLLLYVGALFKTKGLETILQALAKTKNESLSLCVIGDGIDKKYFESKVQELLINNKVAFIGKIPNEEVFSYMKRSDALVLISHETFGMVYVEAMSQACIPIGANKEGIDGIVIDNVNGFLSPLSDSEALGRLFDSFETFDETAVNRISKAAYETSKKLTINRLAEELLLSPIMNSNTSDNS